MTRLHRVCLLLLALSPAILFAQAAPQKEAGKFRLHKFEQAIGEENYTITPDGSALTLKTDFKFTDRGTPVPLTATLRTSDSYVPQSFVINGNTSRMSKTDTEVTINGDNATIRQGKDTRTLPTPADVLHHLRLRAGRGADGDDALLAHARPARADGNAAAGRGPHSGPWLGDDRRRRQAHSRSSATPCRG